MSEKEIKKVVSGLEKCKLVVNDGKFVVECPKDVVVEATRTMTEDGVLIREIKVEVEKGD